MILYITSGFTYTTEHKDLTFSKRSNVLRRNSAVFCHDISFNINNVIKSYYDSDGAIRCLQ